MSYLTCPSCGLTVFERNPLTSPRRCPRCARRAREVDLEPVAQPRAREAPDPLRAKGANPVEGAE